MPEQLQSAVPASQQPAGATGMSPGPDGQMYFHDASGKQMGLSPDNIQQDDSEPTPTSAAQPSANAAQKPKFDPTAPYESVTVAGEPVQQKTKFDPSAPYQSVTVGGQPGAVSRFVSGAWDEAKNLVAALFLPCGG